MKIDRKEIKEILIGIGMFLIAAALGIKFMVWWMHIGEIK